jgi:hypothetical protein
VPEPGYDLIKSGVLKLTIRSPNFSDELCTRGKSNYLALPNTFWWAFLLQINHMRKMGKD